MNYLLQGMERSEYIEILLSLTKIDSENVVSAIYDHLVNGHREVDACLLNNIPRSNLKRALNKLNFIAGQVEKAKLLS